MLVACLLGFSASTLFAQVRATYLYSLSDFSGRLRYDWVRVAVDQEHEEIYVVYQDLVRIFSASGMEIFSFGDDVELGHVVDLVVEPQGDIILLSYKDSRSVITRCDFRGVPIAPFEIRNLPPEVAFRANRVVYRDGLLYFVSQRDSSVIITDSNGEFRKRIELLSLVEEGDKQKDSAEIDGFAVDEEGNIFFTIPSMFRAYKLSPDGRVASFGKAGSAPGRFGVIAGIAVDSGGHVLVVDKLKCVVMVFDRDFTFLTEFGHRGERPENLIVPDDVAVDRKHRVYVSQGRRRGVSVFALASVQ